MVVDKVSPVIYMRAQKNDVEKEGMRRAHIRDAAAMCDVLAYLEQKVILAKIIKWTTNLTTILTLFYSIHLTLIYI